MYYGFPSNTPVNQLGITPPNNTLTSPQPTGIGRMVYRWIGITGEIRWRIKGPQHGRTIMLLAESDFLRPKRI